MSSKPLVTVPEKLPTHLKHAPLVEAVFELRFVPKEPSVAQLLPGLVFSKLGNKYGRSEATPIGSIPAELREKNPKLRYQAQHRLIASEGSATILLGDQVAAVSVGPPYEGWTNFYPRINEFLDILGDSNLIRRVERFSIKFSNLLEGPPGTQLGAINFKAELGGIQAPERGFRFRTEVNDEVFIRIIDLATNAEVLLPSGERKVGLMLSLDCIRTMNGQDFWSIRGESIDELHVELKKLFFGLITEQTLAKLEPTYGA